MTSPARVAVVPFDGTSAVVVWDARVIRQAADILKRVTASGTRKTPTHYSQHAFETELEGWCLPVVVDDSIDKDDNDEAAVTQLRELLRNGEESWRAGKSVPLSGTNETRRAVYRQLLRWSKASASPVSFMTLKLTVTEHPFGLPGTAATAALTLRRGLDPRSSLTRSVMIWCASTPCVSGFETVLADIVRDTIAYTGRVPPDTFDAKGWETMADAALSDGDLVAYQTAHAWHNWIEGRRLFVSGEER